MIRKLFFTLFSFLLIHSCALADIIIISANKQKENAIADQKAVTAILKKHSIQKETKIKISNEYHTVFIDDINTEKTVQKVRSTLSEKFQDSYVVQTETKKAPVKISKKETDFASKKIQEKRNESKKEQTPPPQMPQEKKRQKFIIDYEVQKEENPQSEKIVYSVEKKDAYPKFKKGYQKDTEKQKDRVSIEMGQSPDENQNIFLVNYDSPKLSLIDNGYMEFSLGYWGSKREAFISGISHGYRLEDRFFFDAAIGVFAASETSKNISSALNFGSKIGIGYRKGNFDIGLYYRHFSNAGIKDPNEGEDFITLNVSYRY